MEKIYIRKGDSTIFAENKNFLTFNIETELDLTNWSAIFKLQELSKPINDISSKSFEIVLTSEETSTLKTGSWNGTLVLIDADKNIKTVTTKIPFEVTLQVIENQPQVIDLDIPGTDIKLRVGSNVVTSINGLTGDVVLDIPDTSTFALKSEIPDVSDFVTKDELPDTSDFALKSEIPDTSNLATKDELPDLTGYSKTMLLTQADYDALETKDANTLYLIEE